MKFSPEAIAVASFTFVVALLIGGWQQVALLVHGLIVPVLPGGGGRTSTSILVAVTVIAVAVGAAVLARSAAAATTQGWARALGEATTLVAGLIVIAAIIYATSSIVGHGYPLWGGFAG